MVCVFDKRSALSSRHLISFPIYPPPPPLKFLLLFALCPRTSSTLLPYFLVKRTWKWLLCRQTVTLFFFLMMVTRYRSFICKWHQYKVLVLRGFNKHRRLTKHVGYTTQRSWLLFSPKEEGTILNNVMDKNRICSREIVHNTVIMICSLLVGFNCVANRSKFDLNPNLPEWNSFILSLVLWMLEIAYLGLCNFKILWGSMPSDTLWKRGLLAPCWNSWLLYSDPGPYV